MAMVKRSVAIEEDVAQEALELAGERGFSRFVNDALRLYIQRRRIEEIEREFVKEYGPLTPETKAWGEKIEWPR